MDATDGSAAMVRKTNERFGIAARVMRFDELNASERYDAVWAHACLLHVARADLPAILAAIHRALRHDGLHYASYKLGNGEGRDGLGRLHNFPDANWLAERYTAAGFQIVSGETFLGKGADGVKRDWRALTVRKPLMFGEAVKGPME